MSATSHPVNVKSVEDFVAEQWKNGIYESLCEYIKVPNRSPGFDPTCLTNGLQDKAMEVLVNWVKTQQVHGMKYQVHSEPDRTPLLLINIDGTNNTSETLLMYGHMDKQPPMDEVKGAWEHGSGPWTPVLHDGKLYGRGGADDGYAIFAAITAIRALQLQKVSHARIVILIEACEESGSKDLPYYVDKFSAEIGVPSLVICLDSGCHNYEQLWLTTSLRGVLVGTLSVKILDEAVHSGMASGIVPSSFRVTRQLLDRLEDSKTGKMIDIFNVPIPDEHHRYAQEVAHTIGNIIHTRFRFVKGAHAVETNNAENLLNATWRPTLSVTGAEGLPPLGSASNVVRTETKLKLSIRLPPTLDCTALAGQVKAVLEANPPYGAQVGFDGVTAMQGWCAPKLDSWLEKSLNDASNAYFKKPVRLTGEGGSIPFMGMLGAKFPKTQFVITGILGPSSNAHAPNEFLHVGMFHGVSACVANIVADHYTHKVHA